MPINTGRLVVAEEASQLWEELASAKRALTSHKALKRQRVALSLAESQPGGGMKPLGSLLQ